MPTRSIHALLQSTSSLIFVRYGNKDQNHYDQRNHKRKKQVHKTEQNDASPPLLNKPLPTTSTENRPVTIRIAAHAVGTDNVLHPRPPAEQRLVQDISYFVKNSNEQDDRQGRNTNKDHQPGNHHRQSSDSTNDRRHNQPPRLWSGGKESLTPQKIQNLSSRLTNALHCEHLGTVSTNWYWQWIQ